jgi:hypothetical protein
MIPRAPPIAAPVVNPSMVVLVIEGVFVANIKPAAAIHKVQITIRMFIGVLLAAALRRHCVGRFIPLEGNNAIG